MMPPHPSMWQFGQPPHPHNSMRRENQGPASKDVPKFVRKWFALTDPQRHDLRMRKKDFLAKKSSDTQPALTEDDFDDLVKVVPKFAAKWFLLPDEKRKEFRQAARRGEFAQAHFGRMPMMTSPQGVPHFARRWMAMPERRRRWLKQMMRERNDDVSKEGTPAEMKIPRCASKWFAMSDEERKTMREKMRQHKREHGCRARHCDVSALRKSMEDMSMTSPPSGGQQQAMSPPMPFGPWFQGGVHPGPHMMWQAGAGHQHPMQAMMWGKPCHARKWWKRQALRHALANSWAEKSNDAVTSAPDSDDVMITKTEMADMPEFARRWFDLPMPVRFRLFKLFRRSGGSLPDGVP